jgi:acetyl-CoA carboxylase beta subunit
VRGVNEVITFIAGIICSTMLFALIKDNLDEWEEIEEGPQQSSDDLEINDDLFRHVTLSCQTCRKLKRHKEIEHNLFQCVKCKRHVDIRASYHNKV